MYPYGISTLIPVGIRREVLGGMWKSFVSYNFFFPFESFYFCLRLYTENIEITQNWKRPPGVSRRKATNEIEVLGAPENVSLIMSIYYVLAVVRFV